MTLSSITPLITYTATAGQTDFPLPCQYYDQADAKAWLINEVGETSFANPAGFSVIQTSAEQIQPGLKTGFVRLVTPRSDGDVIVIGVWPKADQDQKYHGVPITARERERVVDRFGLRDAMLREFIGRAYRAPLNEALGTGAGRVIGPALEDHVPMWDEDGNLVPGPSVAEILAAAGVAAGRALVYPEAPADPVYDAGGRKIGSLADGTEPDDAATVGQLPVISDVEFSDLADSTVQTAAEGGATDVDDQLPTVARVAAMMRDAFASISPADFGAAPDGTDSHAAMLLALAAMDSSGIPINLGPYTWTVFDGIDYTFTRKPIIFGKGGQIKLNRGISPHIDRVVDFRGNFGGDFRNWSVDANRQSYNGIVLMNLVASSAEADLNDVFMEDVGAINVYRSGTAHLGGFGIWVFGAHRQVHMVRPFVKNLKLAVGAGTPSVIGVHGIEIDNNGVHETREILIEDPRLEDIYSEDPAYVFDQDGIVCFGAPPSTTLGTRSTCRIKGGTFINAGRGRGIKMARRGGIVDGASFTRLSASSGGFSGRGFMEIDFQYGEGKARNISYFHDGMSVEKIISMTCGDYLGDGLDVENVAGFAEPGSTPVMDAVVLRTYSGAYKQSKTLLRNVSHRGKFVPYLLQHDGNKDTTTSPLEQIMVKDCLVETLSSGLVRRGDGDMVVVVQGCVNGGVSLPAVVDTLGISTVTKRDNILLT